MSITRNYVDEYRQARRAKHAASTMQEEEAAEKLARKIGRAATRAGVELDCITLDEQARLEVFPDALRARVI